MRYQCYRKSNKCTLLVGSFTTITVLVVYHLHLNSIASTMPQNVHVQHSLKSNMYDFKHDSTSLQHYPPRKNSSETLENIKNNLIIMRKYLEAKSSGSNKSIEGEYLHGEEYEKSHQFLEQNADMFVKIADYIVKAGYKQETEHKMKISDSLNQMTETMINTKLDFKEMTQLEIQKWRIKNDDQPMYVDYAANAESVYNREQLKKIKFYKQKLDLWDLFYVRFPDYRMQEAILQNFKLNPEIFRSLERQVQQFELSKGNKKLPQSTYLELYSSQETESWKKFHQHINQYELYDPDDPVFTTVIKELNTLPLTESYQPDSGTQQKLLYYLSNNLRVIFKPMRFPRQQEALPDHMFWRDFERHHAEIAAFHLDMVLGFHRVPPTIGRYVNVTSEIQELDVNHELVFFKSPAGNKCFYGKCTYYCDTAHAVCGHPEVMEGSFMMYLPSSKYARRISWRHPWRRTYSKTTKKAAWEKTVHYCDAVKLSPPYNTGRRLLDLMDMAVFDFLSGNMDRHHYETFEDFGNFTFPILFDNGRGFGKSSYDELTILAPIYQCCQIRYSTLKKLLAFHKGPGKLSDAMRESLLTDQAKPVLLERHLQALDRRVAIILRTVAQCLTSQKLTQVVIDDGI